MKLALFAYSRNGCNTARRVRAALAEYEAVLYTMARFQEPDFLPLAKWVYGECFESSDVLIFVGACGIAVREIAPYVCDKKTDPAVLDLDERGQFVIPLLSGHIGGANRLALELAQKLGATAVITTATDINGKFAVDSWAAQHGCAISSMPLAKAVAAEILERDVPICSDFKMTGALPGGIVQKNEGALGIYIGYQTRAPFERTLRLAPRVLRVGVGCRRGIGKDAIMAAIRAVFEENGLDMQTISGLFSIDLKKDEAGLLEACRENGWPIQFYSVEQLQAAPGAFTASAFVSSVTGVDNVCERAASLGAEKLLVKKTAQHGVTVAVALEHWEVRFG